MPQRYAVRDQGVALSGFTQLQVALRRVEGVGDYGLAYEVQAQMRRIGEKVALDAPGFVTHKTGRHGSPSVPKLEDSVHVSVTTRSASVYSSAEHGGVQNVGGFPHAGVEARGPHVKRADASHWMNRAVAENYAFVELEVNRLIERLLSEFEAA